MIEEIKEFKEKNGNVVYTTKELIQALHTKVDCIDRKLDKKLDKKADKIMVWKLIGGLILVMGIMASILK